MNEVEVVAGRVTLPLPEVFQALSAALPVVLKFFGDTKQPAVSSRDLHKMVGGSYKHNPWVEAQIKDSRLVEDVDFIKEALDATNPSNKQIIAANRGHIPVSFLFRPKAAAKIVSRSKADEAHLIYDYMYWVTDAATPTLLRMWEEAKKEALGADRRMEVMTTTYQTALQKLGMPSVSHTQNYLMKLKDLEDAQSRAELAEDRAAATPNLLHLINSSAKDLRVAKSLDRVKVIVDGMVNAAIEIEQGNMNVRTWY